MKTLKTSNKDMGVNNMGNYNPDKIVHIASISATTHDSSFGGYQWKVHVVVRMRSKEWTKLRNKKQLGQLYRIDISNVIYSINNNIPASCPTVDDTKRSKSGFKEIQLTYFLNDPNKAEALGLKVKRYKNGEFSSAFSDYVLIDTDKVFKLI